jgi:hypothetical protein
MIKIKPDPNADPLLMVLPLSGPVSQAVGNDLNRTGHGKSCGACGKPFNAARKQRDVGRITYVDPAGGGIYSTAWIFCGRCAGEIRRNGGRMPAPLVQEAREAVRAGLLLSAPAGGCA